MTGGRTIAAQYGSSSGDKQQYFGRVDPFVMFAVVPILLLAVLFFWSGIGILGVVLIAIGLLIIVFDSWANRPVKKSPPPRSRDDY
jgi:Na+/melibiose symporter-like transporter